MRRKFDNPDAAGILVRRQSIEDHGEHGDEEQSMAKPCTNCGAVNAMKLASGGEPGPHE